MMAQKALEVLLKKLIYYVLMFWWGKQQIASFVLNFLRNKVKYALVIFKYLQCHQARPLNEEILYSSFH